MGRISVVGTPLNLSSWVCSNKSNPELVKPFKRAIYDLPGTNTPNYESLYAASSTATTWRSRWKSMSEKSHCSFDLPNELMTMIFLFLLEDEDPMHTSAKPVILYSSRCHIDVTTLCRINRQWRDVASSTHRLWNSMYISNPTEKTVNLLKMRFEHIDKDERRLPLDVEIFSMDQDAEGAGAALVPILDRLPFLRSLKVVLPNCCIDMENEMYNEGLVHLLRDQCILHPDSPIQRLHISISDDLVSDETKVIRLWKSMVSFRNLQELKWDHRNMTILPRYRLFNAPNLKIIELKRCRCIDLYFILSSCPRAEDITLTHVVDGYDVHMDNQPIIKHKFLKSLAFKGNYYLLKLFDKLTLPSLTTLFLQYGPGTPFGDTFHDFFTRSAPPLASLIYQQMGLYDTGLDHEVEWISCLFLQNIPHLGFWGSSSYYILKQFMERDSSGRHRYLPDVKHLELNVTGISIKWIIDFFIRDRSRFYPREDDPLSGGHVEEFTLRRVEKYEGRDLLLLEHAQRQGLRIRLVQAPYPRMRRLSQL